jgi:uncharacterized protein (TIGR03083 family)
MGRVSGLRQPDPIIVVDRFPEVLHQLLDLLGSLSDEDWKRPTACTGWSVKDVALHLLGGEVGNLSRRRDDYALITSIASMEELVAVINDWNQSWIVAGRRISPRLLIDLLQLTGVQMCDYFRGLDPFAMGDAVSWAGPEPAPVWLDLAREYTERWHHQQHIRDGVGKPGLKQPKYFSPVLAAFVRALPEALRTTEAPDNTSVTLTIPGDSGGQWSALRHEAKWRLYAGAPERPDSEVTVDQETAWRLFTRGLGSDSAAGQVVVTGDASLGSAVLDMVSIIA